MKMPQIPFPPRIIVIDDNPAIHDDFRKILCPAVEESPADAMEAEIFGETDGLGYAPEEYDVATALQGQEGLEKIVAAIGAANPFSVAFVDGRMPPGWDGVETIQRIWKQVPDLQIVFCTAFSDYSWREVLSRIGASRHRCAVAIRANEQTLRRDRRKRVRAARRPFRPGYFLGRSIS